MPTPPPRNRAGAPAPRAVPARVDGTLARAVCALALTLLGSAGAFAQGSARPKEASGLEGRTQSMQHLPGFMPLYWDGKAGRLYLSRSPTGGVT